MALHEEIQERRAEIRSDGYPMSIGELVNLYRDGELNIHPEFQRFFRWTATQKARLIESLLLGIPLPSIFVSQRDDGVWDVVDGLQRLSTIFEFMGILKNEGDECVEPLVLVKTKYLPSLEKRTWRDDGTHQGIGSENQLIIKRSKIDVKIILRESSEGSKYELFQRLNTGGSQLSAQELRNVLMITVDPTLYRWVSELSNNRCFRSCLGISDRAELEQYDLELVCRFLVLRDLDEPGLKGIPEFGEFLTESMLELATASEREKREMHGGRIRPDLRDTGGRSWRRQFPTIRPSSAASPRPVPDLRLRGCCHGSRIQRREAGLRDRSREGADRSPRHLAGRQVFDGDRFRCGNVIPDSSDDPPGARAVCVNGSPNSG